MAGLTRTLAGGVTLLVGQSGVGKSSLVNALAPAAAAQTAELTRDDEGRHTTTTARWYALGAQAAIIDAPGVRDFAPPASLVRAAERGFVEIHRLGVNCRFKDCRHMEEPGCAVRAALQDGRLAPERWQNYLKLRDELAAAADSLEAQMRRKSEARVLTKTLTRRLGEKYGKH